MSASAGEGFGAHPFGEIARATVAAQERGLELAQFCKGKLAEVENKVKEIKAKFE